MIKIEWGSGTQSLSRKFWTREVREFFASLPAHNRRQRRYRDNLLSAFIASDGDPKVLHNAPARVKCPDIDMREKWTTTRVDAHTTRRAQVLKRDTRHACIMTRSQRIDVAKREHGMPMDANNRARDIADNRDARDKREARSKSQWTRNPDWSWKRELA